MLENIAQRLDEWLAEQNALAREGGWALHRPCTIKLLGQVALIEAGVELGLAATKDVDVYADYDDAVEKEFARLLAAVGYELDPVGHEVWMPRETCYSPRFDGRFVQLVVAEVEAVLLSKALKAPVKNSLLIAEYLAKGASSRFLELAKRYHLKLEQFL
jgi:hypothetical protein